MNYFNWPIWCCKKVASQKRLTPNSFMNRKFRLHLVFSCFRIGTFLAGCFWHPHTCCGANKTVYKEKKTFFSHSPFFRALSTVNHMNAELLKQLVNAAGSRQTVAPTTTEPCAAPEEGCCHPEHPQLDFNWRQQQKLQVVHHWQREIKKYIFFLLLANKRRLEISVTVSNSVV